MQPIFDTSTWAVHKNFNVFGDDAIEKICAHFKEVIFKNGCGIRKVPSEFLTFKTQVAQSLKTKEKAILNTWNYGQRSFSAWIYKRIVAVFSSDRADANCFFHERPSGKIIFKNE